MSNGYINLPRSLLRDPLWKSLPYTYRHVFFTILDHAAWKEITMDDFGVLINLKPGQLLVTYRQMAEWCDEDDIDKRIVERAWEKFEKIGFIKLSIGNRKTVVTITRKDICDVLLPFNDSGRVFEKKGQKPGQTSGQENQVKDSSKTNNSETTGTNFGTNSGQTRDIKEEYINTDKKIDLIDLIDAREDLEFDLIFEHKKFGSIGIMREVLVCEMEDSYHTREDVELAIEKMIKQNPILNGTIQAYLKPILKQTRQNRKQCNTTKKEEYPPKKKSKQSNEFYMGNDLSETPLAKFARSRGLN